MKELFGFEIEAIYTNKSRTLLAFINSWGKNYIYEAIGDCCSETWFESISDLNVLLDSEVIGLEKKFLPNVSSEKGSLIQAYGYTLKTEKGYCDIEYRNESNGYYGGDCRLVEEDGFLYFSKDKKIGDTAAIGLFSYLRAGNPIFYKSFDGIELNPWTNKDKK
jgi:hypothetical protein